MNRFKKILQNNLGALVLIIGLFCVKFWVADFYLVRGSSMLPTLEDGQRILALKQSSISPFDVVILNSHQEGDTGEEKLFIKRVIGIEGDQIEYKDHTLYINGQKVEEPFLDNAFSKLPENQTGDFQVAMEVPKDQYFVLGDNRNHSADSRQLGFIAKEDIVAEAFIVVFPQIKGVD